MKKNFIKGAYFIYCQCCRWDGHCHLRHYQYLGTKSIGHVDKSPYLGHENLSWGFSIFQNRTKRSGCNGRIHRSDSCFFPLICECSTVLSSLKFSLLSGGEVCVRLQPNKKGKKMLKSAEMIACKRKVNVSEIDLRELPEFDPDYQAVMMI